MKKKRVAVIFRGFQNPIPFNPKLLWQNVLEKLSSYQTIKISLFDPFKKSLFDWQFYQKIKKGNFDEIYIIGSYFSVPFYVFLCRRSISKKVYVLRNRISLNQYWAVFKKYPLFCLHPFYLFSMLSLGWLYQLITKFWHISCFIFPNQTSLKEFVNDTGIKSKCFLLPSPLPKISLLNNVRSSWQKKKGEKWLIYTGRASLFRGLEVLTQAFKKMHQQDKNLKLICLFLKERQKNIVNQMFKKLAKKSYLVNIGRMSNNDYYRLFRQADVFIGPYCFAYGIPGRPTTLLEAMALKVPLVISKIVNDNYFKDGQNCLKFNNLNIEDLKRKVRRVLNDNQLRNKLVKNAQVDVQQLHMNNIFKQYFMKIFQV